MLTEADFAIVAQEVKARTGAVLGKDTNALVENRLQPMARREGFSSVAELILNAKIKPDGKIWNSIADALAQSETRFFRDRGMFLRLQNDILPDLFARRGGALRMWCAGVGAGQEAYSLAMLVEDMRESGPKYAEIVATDFSERALDKARSGLYTQFEVQRGLPIRKLIAHFEKAGDLWRISDRMRAAVKFQAHNLMQPANALSKDKFDLVLCCNVLCGFDAETRLAAVARIAETMTSDGVLILGRGEPLPAGADGFAGDDACFTRGLARAA